MTLPTSQAVTPTERKMEAILVGLVYGTPPYSDEQIEIIQWLANRELFARRASMKEHPE